MRTRGRGKRGRGQPRGRGNRGRGHGHGRSVDKPGPVKTMEEQVKEQLAELKLSEPSTSSSRSSFPVTSVSTRITKSSSSRSRSETNTMMDLDITMNTLALAPKPTMIFPESNTAIGKPNGMEKNKKSGEEVKEKTSKSTKAVIDHETERKLLEEEFLQIRELIEKKMTQERKLYDGSMQGFGFEFFKDPLYLPCLPQFHRPTSIAMMGQAQPSSTKALALELEEFNSSRPVNKATVTTITATEERIGTVIKNPKIHICSVCKLPIRIYGRMIPCKHAFCKTCAFKDPSSCTKCFEKVNRIETFPIGALFMCHFNGSRYGSDGCRRTYVSQRDLDAHFNFRHKSCGNAKSQPQPLSPGTEAETGPDPVLPVLAPAPIENNNEVSTPSPSLGVNRDTNTGIISGPCNGNPIGNHSINIIINGSSISSGNANTNTNSTTNVIGKLVWNKNNDGWDRGYGYASRPFPYPGTGTMAPPPSLLQPMPMRISFVPPGLPVRVPFAARGQGPRPFYHFTNPNTYHDHGYGYLGNCCDYERNGEQNRLPIRGRGHGFGRQPRPHPFHPYWQWAQQPRH